MALPETVQFELKYKSQFGWPRHRFLKTAFREPKKGEHYLSGAVPCAYLAPNDLGVKYWIVRPVKLVQVTQPQYKTVEIDLEKE
jgi:hypothetical protein